MKNIFISLFISIFISGISSTAFAQEESKTFTFTCPSVDSIQFKTQKGKGGWVAPVAKGTPPDFRQWYLPCAPFSTICKPDFKYTQLIEVKKDGDAVTCVYQSKLNGTEQGYFQLDPIKSVLKYNFEVQGDTITATEKK